MKKVLAILFLSTALLATVASAGPKMRTQQLLFGDGATVSFLVNIAAKDSSGTVDTDTTLSIDLSNFDWDGDTTRLVGVVDVRWPYVSAGGYSNDGDSLYLAWMYSLDDSIYTLGTWSTVQAADSNATYGYKYKILNVKGGNGAFGMPFGYRYYKLLVRQGSCGAEAGDGAPLPDTNANLYDVRASFRARRAD